jgi:hypothetical protein
MGTSEWSKSEKEIERSAFNMAYTLESSEEEYLTSMIQRDCGAFMPTSPKKDRKRIKNTTTDTRFSLLYSPGFYMKDGPQ